jgi:hypothetical protein
VSGSTSSALTYVVNPPQVTTTVGLTGPASVAQYSPASYVASMTEGDSTTQPGSVAFTAAGTGATTGTSTLGTVATTTSTATLNVTQLTLAPGTYNVTATFTPTSNGYQTSTSPAVALTVTAPACKGSPDPSGATCSDTQNIQVTVNPGSLTITTPYTSANPYILPAMQLNAGGTLLSTSQQFPKAGDPEIVVHSSLAGDPNWTVSVTDSDLTTTAAPISGEYNVINGENLGLTAGHLDTTVTPAFPGTVAFTDNPAANGVNPSDSSGGGLKGSPAKTFAVSSGGGNGSASMFGTLTLNAPTQTEAGTYNGTITFSVS